MDNFNKSAMIALVPTEAEWCKQDCPHLTLVYAGEIPDLPADAFNDLAKDAASLAMLSNPIWLKVTGLDVFGDVTEERVNVLKLQPSSELLAMRRVVEHWNASQFPFNPHVTVGPSHLGVDLIPDGVSFDQVLVGWGDEHIPFRMKR